jgi:hypothetical protein
MGLADDGKYGNSIMIIRFARRKGKVLSSNLLTAMGLSNASQCPLSEWLKEGFCDHLYFPGVAKIIKLIWRRINILVCRRRECHGEANNLKFELALLLIFYYMSYK